MPNGETTLLTKLILLGAVIAAGQVMNGKEQITLRLVLSRLILGVAVALISGVVLIHSSELPELAIIGVASAMSIAGHTAVEAAAQSWLRRKGGNHDSGR